ncbi:MAG: cyclic nucleotide-binding domain-containing protein [Burkholderiales bacterium]|jgi:CRP-like cAMP-binding protein|nr:cyclic nucleotide-binding domain-containing protein [Burkholderiales bacterium]
MNAQDLQPLLAQHPFSKDFRPQQIERLAAQARRATFEPEQVVFRSGDDSTDFFLIVSGRLALEMAVGKKVLRIQTLSDGDEFGFSSLITGRPTTFQARALQRIEALAFDGNRLLESCQADPQFGFSLMRKLLLIVSERLDATRLQLMDTYSPVAARAGA